MFPLLPVAGRVQAHLIAWVDGADCASWILCTLIEPVIATSTQLCRLLRGRLLYTSLPIDQPKHSSFAILLFQSWTCLLERLFGSCYSTTARTMLLGYCLSRLGSSLALVARPFLHDIFVWISLPSGLVSTFRLPRKLGIEWLGIFLVCYIPEFPMG